MKLSEILCIGGSTNSKKKKSKTPKGMGDQNASSNPRPSRRDSIGSSVTEVVFSPQSGSSGARMLIGTGSSGGGSGRPNLLARYNTSSGGAIDLATRNELRERKEQLEIRDGLLERAQKKIQDLEKRVQSQSESNLQLRRKVDEMKLKRGEGEVSAVSFDSSSFSSNPSGLTSSKRKMIEDSAMLRLCKRYVGKWLRIFQKLLDDKNPDAHDLFSDPQLEEEEGSEQVLVTPSTMRTAASLHVPQSTPTPTPTTGSPSPPVLTLTPMTISSQAGSEPLPEMLERCNNMVLELIGTESFLRDHGRKLEL